jgi:hypothetical protein
MIDKLQDLIVGDLRGIDVLGYAPGAILIMPG